MKLRNLLTVIILSIITLGIYSLYWMYDTSKGLRERGINSPHVSVLLLPILVMVSTILVFIVSTIALGPESMPQNQPSLINVVLIVLGGISIVSMPAVVVWWGYRFNQAIERASHGEIDSKTYFLIYLVTTVLGLFVVWQALIQSEINKLIDGNNAKLSTPSSSKNVAAG